ncbi:MAG: hypothetical protein LBD44_05965 [Spirochaetaceae bacterium]|nr:hypothetical protein [Spirochaetaceae bacterium]
MNRFKRQKNILGAAILFLFIVPVTLGADDNLIDSDFDKLFTDSSDETGGPTEDKNTNPVPYSTLQDFITRSGFGVDTSYSMVGGYLPGWFEAPWYFGDYGDSDKDITNLIGAKMSASVGLDIQPSRYLHVRQSFTFAIPAPALTIKEFFFDYNFRDKFFIKAGKFDIVWGVSPNFPFANLLARIPLDIENPGDPYLAKLNIPVDVGGFEFVLLTRPGYIDTTNPRIEDFGSGIKYNLALQSFDMDIGFFYFELMPLRGFWSVKTTLFKNLEVYADSMINIFYDKQIEQWADFGFSASIGFVNTFLNDKLRLNMEVYYDGEGDAASLRRNDLLDDEPDDFRLFSGFNGALNISFKPGGIGRMHIFFGFLYAFEKRSGQVVPGITFDPVDHVELYIAAPMAVGARDQNSYYYHNADTNNRPFSVVLAVKIKGTYKYSHFE